MARASALRRAFAFAAVALLLVAAAPSAAADDASDVITLTSSNFDVVVNKEKIIVRAPRHCAAARCMQQQSRRLVPRGAPKPDAPRPRRLPAPGGGVLRAVVRYVRPDARLSLRCLAHSLPCAARARDAEDAPASQAIASRWLPSGRRRPRS